MSPAGALPEAMTLPALLIDAASRAPDREALVAGATRWTYAQLSVETERIARGLSTLGLSSDSVLGLLVPNVAQWVPAAFGAMRCGARVDAFNTWVKAYELEYLLRASGASVLVTMDRVRDSNLVSELGKLIPDLFTAAPGEWRSKAFPELRHVVVIGNDVPSGASSWSEVSRRAVPASEPPPIPGREHADKPAYVIYTSGSTKNPKAVPLRHRDLIVNGFYIGERMGLSEQDRIWFGSPLFWSFGAANAHMATMTHQACLVLQEQFDAIAAVELMANEAVTAAYLLPSMVAALTGRAAAPMRAVTSLRTGLTIGRPEEVRRAAVDLGIKEICNVYGSTETYGNCCVTDYYMPLEQRIYTQGKPLPGIEIRVVDPESGRELAVGESGELQVRGRVTPGYLNDEEANATAFTPDGWYRTGDRMLINPDGTVSFEARITEMIKTSGINVSPLEVESYLSTHPDIAEVLVLGAPYPSRDEIVVAFVVSRSGQLTPSSIIDYCRGNLAGYKVPWVVSVVAELPRTGTGKAARRDLMGAAAAMVEERLRDASAGRAGKPGPGGTK